MFYLVTSRPWKMLQSGPMATGLTMTCKYVQICSNYFRCHPGCSAFQFYCHRDPYPSAPHCEVRNNPVQRVTPLETLAADILRVMTQANAREGPDMYIGGNQMFVKCHVFRRSSGFKRHLACAVR